MIVYLSGQFIDESRAKISALSPGVLCGWGLFETMRSRNGHIVGLNEHIERMQSGSRAIGMPAYARPGRLKKLIAETVRRNKSKDAVVRLTQWEGIKGIELLITAREHKGLPARIRARGMKAIVSTVRNQEGGLFPRLKTTGYLPYLWAFRQAEQQGCDEALVLTTRGNLSEASRSNLFFCTENTLYTPDLSCGCLNGITRGVVIGLARKKRIPLYEGRFTPEQLYHADEAFLTGSVKGVVPLTVVSGRKIGKRCARPLTKALMREYNKLVQGKPG